MSFNFLVGLMVLNMIFIIHEMGHYLAAKLFGISVEIFSIGIGPVLFKRIKNGETFQLCLFPIVGYVRLRETTDSAECICFPDSGMRGFCISFAGPLFNWLTAFIGLLVLNFIAGIPLSTNVVESVREVNAQSSSSASSSASSIASSIPMQSAKVQKNDQIIYVNSIKCTASNVKRVLAKSRNCDAEFVVKRDGEYIAIKINRPVNGYGIQFQQQYVKFEVLNAVKQSVRYIASSSADVVIALFEIAKTFNLSSLMGPLGIVNMIGGAYDDGFIKLLFLIVSLSISLAVFNLLPIPGLDMFHMISFLISSIFRRSLNGQVLMIAKALGVIFVLFLSLTVTWFDVKRLL